MKIKQEEGHNVRNESLSLFLLGRKIPLEHRRFLVEPMKKKKKKRKKTESAAEAIIIRGERSTNFSAGPQGSRSGYNWKAR